jgi:Xaa-Pro aminopeptidase
MNVEFNGKLAQVRALLKANKAEAAMIGKQSNFSWLACGGEAHVALISQLAVGRLLVTAKKVHLMTSRIEMPRLLDEAVRGLGVVPLPYDWYDPDGAVKALKEVFEPAKVISDTGEWGTQNRQELFTPLRYALYPAEVKRLRVLCRDAEAAMNEACHLLKPGLDEFQIAGILSHSCWQRQITPAVTLIAVDERIRRYRHPIPTRKKLKRHAMLVLCARRQGLVVSVTRLVHFGKLPADLRRRHDAVCAVDAAFISNTRLGTPIREIFRRGTEAYAEQGFADEWKLHHQGGPCSYEPRDYVGTPTAPGVVLEHQAFAWNPSIAGTKSEDTILATAKGPEILTAAKAWPMLEIKHAGETLLRPDILVR